MRNPNRLCAFYNELTKIHAEVFPDWRFGQLMTNFMSYLTEKGVDPFFPEENEMIKYLKEFANMH